MRQWHYMQQTALATHEIDAIGRAKRLEDRIVRLLF